VLGRKKDTEGKLKNYCKIRETTAVYMVSPAGAIEQVTSDERVKYDKYGEQACRGQWTLGNARGREY
jgi:hypothetical protein